MRREVRAAGVSALLAVALVTLRPHPHVLVAALAHPVRWLDRSGPDVVIGQLAGAVLWALAAWVALVLVASVSALLPGTAGRLGNAVSAVVAPAVVRRLVAGSVGLGVVLAPAVALAAPSGNVQASAAQATPVPEPGWPVTSSAAAPSAARSGAPSAQTPVPRPGWPTTPVSSAGRTGTPGSAQAAPGPSPVQSPTPSPSTTTPPSVSTPGWPSNSGRSPSPLPAAPPTSVRLGTRVIESAQAALPRPAEPTGTTPRRGDGAGARPVDGGPAAHSPARQSEGTSHPPKARHPGAGRSRQGEPVTVRPGDSLWLIAQRRLGPQASAAEIIHAWPRWYAANRDVIGDDPTLITPGQVLHVPARSVQPNRSVQSAQHTEETRS